MERGRWARSCRGMGPAAPRHPTTPDPARGSSPGVLARRHHGAQRSEWSAALRCVLLARCASQPRLSLKLQLRERCARFAREAVRSSLARMRCLPDIAFLFVTDNQNQSHCHQARPPHPAPPRLPPSRTRTFAFTRPQARLLLRTPSFYSLSPFHLSTPFPPLNKTTPISSLVVSPLGRRSPTCFRLTPSASSSRQAESSDRTSRGRLEAP